MCGHNTMSHMLHIFVLLCILLAYCPQECMCVVSSRSATTILGISSSTTNIFLDKSADLYQVIRPEVQIKNKIATFTGTQITSSEQVNRWMEEGLGDFGWASYVPSVGDKFRSPDLQVFPLMARAFAACYNIPGIDNDIILSRQVLAKIYIGNITRWDDPSIVALNPDILLPSEPIEVVLQSDPFTFVKEFTRISSKLDADFRTLVGVQSFPVWPTSRYAKYYFVEDTFGPASYVVSKPYSIALSIVSFAQGLGGRVAQMTTSAGAVVAPTFDATKMALLELGVQSTRDAAGNMVHSWSSVLTDAPGQASWPYVFFSGIIMSREYSRQSCHARSEVVKFIRWLLTASATVEDLGRSEGVILINDDIDNLIGLTSFLKNNVSCEHEAINTGDALPLKIQGAPLYSLNGVSTRSLLLLQFVESQKKAGLELSATRFIEAFGSIQRAWESALTSDRPAGSPDAAWVLPLQFSPLRNWETAQELKAGEIDLHVKEVQEQALDRNSMIVPVAIHGIAIRYNLPSNVTKALRNSGSLPLQIDLDLLAELFTSGVGSWLDERLVALNPALPEAFSHHSGSSRITLVVCGDGRQKGFTTSLGQHFILLIKHRPAFQAVLPYFGEFLVPANWSYVVHRALNPEAPAVYEVPSEIQIGTTVDRIVGSVSYTLIDTKDPPENVFVLLREVHLSNTSLSSGATTEASSAASTTTTSSFVPVDASVASLRACGTLAAKEWTVTVNADSEAIVLDPTTKVVTKKNDTESAAAGSSLAEFSLSSVVVSKAETHRACYPLSFLLAIGLPEDALADEELKAIETTTTKGRVDKEYLCNRARNIARFTAWFVAQDYPSWTRTGAASTASIPEMRVQLNLRVRKLSCDSEPLLWTPAFVWSLPAAWRDFSDAISITGLVLCVLTLLILILLRSRTIVRSAGLGFQSTVLAGIILLLVSLILFTRPATDLTCGPLPWMLSFGFTGAFGAPVFKIMHFYMLVSARRAKAGLKRKKRFFQRHLSTIAVIVTSFIDLVLLIYAHARYSTGLLTPVSQDVEQDGSQWTYTTCSFDPSMIPVAATLVGVKGLILVIGVLVGFVAVKAASAFNEMEQLCWAIWSGTLSLALIVPIIIFAGGVLSTAGAVLQLCLLAWLSLSTLGCIFAPRMIHLVRDTIVETFASSSRMSGRSSTLTLSSRGTTGTGTGTGTADFSALFEPISLEGVSLAHLEKYMLLLEAQLRGVKEKRVKELGSAYKRAQIGEIKEEFEDDADDAELDAPPVSAGNNKSGSKVRERRPFVVHRPIANNNTPAPMIRSPTGGTNYFRPISNNPSPAGGSTPLLSRSRAESPATVSVNFHPKLIITAADMISPIRSPSRSPTGSPPPTSRQIWPSVDPSPPTSPPLSPPNTGRQPIKKLSPSATQLTLTTNGNSNVNVSHQLGLPISPISTAIPEDRFSPLHLSTHTRRPLRVSAPRPVKPRTATMVAQETVDEENSSVSSASPR